jgi:hypothetical protein
VVVAPDIYTFWWSLLPSTQVHIKCSAVCTRSHRSLAGAAQELSVQVRGKTNGWVSLGFDAGVGMCGADGVIGYVGADLKPYVAGHYLNCSRRGKPGASACALVVVAERCTHCHHHSCCV